MKKRILSLMLMLCMLAVSVPCAAENGDYRDFKYSTNSDGTIMITGVDKYMISIAVPEEIHGKAVTTIGNRAFYWGHTKNVESITIPNSVTVIKDRAFEGCESLTSVTMPDKIESIGSYAFFNCESLISAVIPEGAALIENGTFSGCTALESVTIPASVTSISDWAFEGCKSLTDVYYGGSKEQWDAINIGEHNEDLTAAKLHTNDEAQTEWSLAEYKQYFRTALQCGCAFYAWKHYLMET